MKTKKLYILLYMSERLDDSALTPNPLPNDKQNTTATVSFIGPRPRYDKEIYRKSLPPRFLEHLIKKKQRILRTIDDDQLVCSHEQYDRLVAVLDSLHELNSSEAHDYANFLEHRIANLLAHTRHGDMVSSQTFEAIHADLQCSISQFLGLRENSN